jgi:hypothetical protein
MVLAEEELAERLYKMQLVWTKQKTMSKGEGYSPAKIVTQCGWDAVRKG